MKFQYGKSLCFGNTELLEKCRNAIEIYENALLIINCLWIAVIEICRNEVDFSSGLPLRFAATQGLLLKGAERFRHLK